MSLFHKLVSGALATGMLLSVTATGVLAAPAADQSAPTASDGYSLQCQDGQCTLHAPTASMSPLARLAAGVAAAALDRGENPLPAGASLTLADDLTLTLPVGQIALPRADLALTLGENGRIQQLHGVAQVPFPSFGLLEDARIVTPVVAEVGLDSGANLAHLNAPLQADRDYLFFAIDDGMEVDAASQRGPLHLSLPAGQRATLVIDTQEPLVYLAGNLTLSDAGQIALAGPLLDAAQSSALIPDSLPLRQRTQVAVTGQYSPDEGASFVELGGGYAVDGGAAARWLGIDAQPLTVNGWARISDQGMLLNGVAAASLAPDTLFRGELGLEAWLPFGQQLDGAYAQVNGAVGLPVADFTTDVMARVSLPLTVQASAQSGAGEVREIVWRPDGGQRSQPTALKRAADSLAGWIDGALDATGQGIASGGRWVSDNAQAGYARVVQWLPAARSE